MPQNMIAAPDRMAEAEVALRLAEYLLTLPGAANTVKVAVDGASVKVGESEVFPIAKFLEQQGWQQTERKGKNLWTGDYARAGKQLSLHSQSGEGDVVIIVRGKKVVAECKKGPLVYKKGSQERRNLTAAIGQALIWDAKAKDAVVVAVPDTERFRKLADE